MTLEQIKKYDVGAINPAEKEYYAEHALTQNGLPTTTEFSPEVLAEAALSDKKRSGGKITLVVPQKIGDCALIDLPVEQLIDVFRAGMEAGA